jgi:DNA-binding NarL/FixJ family response regulator
MNTVVSEGREHVFIVEDNEIYSMMLDYVLSKDSVFKFSSFKSGEECLQNLRQSPRVIILDYNLPGKNGLDVLKEIKQYDPSIHVLMLTNNQDMKLALKLLQEGADDYILKQGHGEKQIIEKVENLLAADQARQDELWRERNRALYKRLAYGIAIASVVVAGVLYFT